MYIILVSLCVAWCAGFPAQASVLFGPVINPSTKHVYYLLTESTWQAAETEAISLGGHLVTINDQTEQDWVFSTFGSYGGINRSLWIGLREVTTEGSYLWVSGESVGYTHWLPTQPDNGNGSGPESYVHMIRVGDIYGHPGGFWNDLASPNTIFPTFNPLCGVVEVMLTPADILTGAVHFQIANGGMTATFTPNYNLTLADAATICGVNHFNWIQWIVFDNDPNRPHAGLTQVSPPYIDPPLGGYQYSGLRDFSPAYWEETPVNDPQYYVGAHTDNVNKVLSFADYPTVTPGYVVQFRTTLAGVKSDGTVITFSFLPGQNWQSQSTGTSVIRDNINASVVTNANSSLIGTFAFNSISGAEITYLQNQQVAGLAPLFTGISRNTNGSVTLNLTAIANSTNRIWSATNVIPPIAWQMIGTNIAGTNGLFNFIDTNASGQKMKFYRISTP